MRLQFGAGGGQDGGAHSFGTPARPAGPIVAKDHPAVLGTFLGLNEKQPAKVIRHYPLSDYKGSTSRYVPVTGAAAALRRNDRLLDPLRPRRRPQRRPGDRLIAYDASAGQVLSLAPGRNGISEVNLGREHRCDFWKPLT